MGKWVRKSDDENGRWEDTGDGRGALLGPGGGGSIGMPCDLFGRRLGSGPMPQSNLGAPAVASPRPRAEGSNVPVISASVPGGSWVEILVPAQMETP